MNEEVSALRSCSRPSGPPRLRSGHLELGALARGAVVSHQTREDSFCSHPFVFLPTAVALLNAYRAFGGHEREGVRQAALLEDLPTSRLEQHAQGPSRTVFLNTCQFAQKTILLYIHDETREHICNHGQSRTRRNRGQRRTRQAQGWEGKPRMPSKPSRPAYQPSEAI